MSLIDKLSLASTDNVGEKPVGNVDEYSADPEPGSKARRRPRATTSASTSANKRPVTAKELTGIADDIEMYLQLVAGPLELRGLPYGMVLSDRAELISKRAAAIVARNPKWRKWFESGTQFGDWIALAQALWPVAKAVYVHHFGGSAADPAQETSNDDLSGFAPFSPTRYAPAA